MQVGTGKSVLNGIAIGKLKIYKKKDTAISTAPVADTAAELERFEAARQKAIEQQTAQGASGSQDGGEDGRSALEERGECGRGPRRAYASQRCAQEEQRERGSPLADGRGQHERRCRCHQESAYREKATVSEELSSPTAKNQACRKSDRVEKRGRGPRIKSCGLRGVGRSRRDEQIAPQQKVQVAPEQGGGRPKKSMLPE